MKIIAIVIVAAASAAGVGDARHKKEHQPCAMRSIAVR